jgi:hypothetical protein
VRSKLSDVVLRSSLAFVAALAAFSLPCALFWSFPDRSSWDWVLIAFAAGFACGAGVGALAPPCSLRAHLVGGAVMGLLWAAGFVACEVWVIFFSGDRSGMGPILFAFGYPIFAWPSLGGYVSGWLLAGVARELRRRRAPADDQQPAP